MDLGGKSSSSGKGAHLLIQSIMSEDCNAAVGENERRMGVHFLDLEEIIDKSKEQGQEDISERQELMRRLFQAEATYKQLRETHDRLFDHGLDIEGFINELSAENKYLTSKVKDLQQQLENYRKRREEEEDKVFRLELLSEEEEKRIRSNLNYIREMEKEIKKLKKEMEDLTAELEQLSLGQKHQEQIQSLRRDGQELKQKLEEIQEVLRRKDEEIEMKSLSLNQRSIELEETLNTIEVLKQEQRELREQLSRRQEEQIIAAQETEGNKREPLGYLLMDEEDETPIRKGWWNRMKGLWKGLKVVGQMALCVLVPVGIMVSVSSVYNSQHPDYNLWNISFGLLEPRLEQALPSVY